MSELQDAIEQVRDKILRYSKASTSINEQNTKASLIQPIMRSLGWDVEDLDDVHMEYKERAADKPVDYALLLLRSPCAFIEAKSLGSPLDDRKWANQIMGYASVAGVEWVVLTNGDEYRIYNSHAAVPVEEKLFRAVKVSDAETDPEATLCLLSKDLMKERQINRLWELHFVDRQVTSALRQLFSTEGEPSASIVRLLSKNVPSLTLGEIKASLRRVEIQISCPLTIEQGKPETAKTEIAKLRKKKAKRKVKATQSGVSLIELFNKKILSAPLTLFKKYKGKELLATVRVDGTVEFDGQQYESCSTAAAYARGTIVGGTPSTNGWDFWKYRDSEGKVHHLDHARCVYRQQQMPES